MRGSDVFLGSGNFMNGDLMGDDAFLLAIPIGFVLEKPWVKMGSNLWIARSVSTGIVNAFVFSIVVGFWKSNFSPSTKVSGWLLSISSGLSS